MDYFTTCPHCGENLTEQEYEQVCDCGCPSCRRFFEIDINDEYGVEPGSWEGGFADNH